RSVRNIRTLSRFLHSLFTEHPKGTRRRPNTSRLVALRMINYTDSITALMQDIVMRVPALSYIDLSRLLVFARYGRADAEGAFATCHCLSLPPSEPGYYYWRDRETGQITRRSEWFVVKSPSVEIEATPIHYLISFTLPRFCNQTLWRSRKEEYYRGVEPWVAKLDTIVHELYHVDPQSNGIRTVERADGESSAFSHGPLFLRSVAEMVMQYLRSNPDPQRFEFLRHSFADLTVRYGGVAATTFRTFPSFPQRYMEAFPPPVDDVEQVRIEPIKSTTRPRRYTDADLVVREFFEERPGSARATAADAARSVRLRQVAAVASACDLLRRRRRARRG
ncbi:MAG: hypothetical protein ACM3NQ_15665, partial [Bacteroidales bacterium]